MSVEERTACGNISLKHVGRTVKLMGWVDALRDHGDTLFIHLRDKSGIVQAVFNPAASSKEVMDRAQTLRIEYCIMLTGRVTERDDDTKNPNLDTGDVEIAADELDILSKSRGLPFLISEKALGLSETFNGTDSVSEDLRLQYRYLDLRRPSMQDHILKRDLINRCVRDYLHENGFVEIETPVLTKSTPEGARDYLVPSRLHPKQFYALPQSPQLFKQLLMISGFERYFQLVRCFRDEDLRPNRQPEFTQLDLEASFIDEEFIYSLMEELIVRMFETGGISLPRPFPRMTYREAVESTGSDRPDLRFDLRFIEATDIFRETGYGIFKQIISRGGTIKGLNVKASSERLSKNVLQNEYAKQIVPGFGAKGMTWMRVLDGTLQSNIIQFFSPEEQKSVLEKFGAENGDVLLMIADPSPEVVNSALGQLRLHIAGRLDLIPADSYCPVWITDFPLFEASEEGVTSSHHPFTSPDRDDFDPEDKNQLLTLQSRAYDLVLNGEELGGGSMRIHDSAVQRKIFRALGLSDEEVEEKFGFFLQALDFGPPPHGGIALGMDRVVSMIVGAPSIREVIAFPKNRSAFCPLTRAPSVVAGDQLEELGLLDMSSVKKIPDRERRDILEALSWDTRIGVRERERAGVEEALKEAARMADLVEKRAGEDDPVFRIIELENRMREGDKPVTSPLAESGDLLKNAPAVKGGFFKVANILE